eukprot:6185105-Pleurochrysis_carterae.AAC.6
MHYGQSVRALIPPPTCRAGLSARAASSGEDAPAATGRLRSPSQAASHARAIRSAWVLQAESEPLPWALRSTRHAMPSALHLTLRVFQKRALRSRKWLASVLVQASARPSFRAA